MDTLDAQLSVTAAVMERGYWNGYTPEQMLARQLAKLSEEAGEAAALLSGSPVAYVPLRADVGAPALQALYLFGGALRGAFERGDWGQAHIVGDPERLWAEICDIGVVWLNLVAAWNAWTHEERDGILGALTKAQGDVGRGVRSG